jgi:DNA-directed RNA polymerase sigma subunit (sigma70/sigma32)
MYFADTYLTEIQKDVLFLRYGIGVEFKRSTESIADKYNKSEQWVRIVTDKAINVLKQKQ